MVLIGFNGFGLFLLVLGGFGSDWFWLVMVLVQRPFRGPEVTMLHGHGNLSKCGAHTRRDGTQNQGGNGAPIRTGLR